MRKRELHTLVVCIFSKASSFHGKNFIREPYDKFCLPEHKCNTLKLLRSYTVLFRFAFYLDRIGALPFGTYDTVCTLRPANCSHINFGFGPKHMLHKFNAIHRNVAELFIFPLFFSAVEIHVPIVCWRHFHCPPKNLFIKNY